MPTGPLGVELRRALTLYLRVPVDDWSAVKHGYKTEFRLGSGTAKAVSYPALLKVDLPTLVVGYMSRRASTEHDKTLLILEDCWREPLASISAESLEREGFESMAHFRRYWTSRTNTRFRPLDQVQVFRIRRYTPDDKAVVGAVLVDWLYGEFTGADNERKVLPRRSPMATSLR